MYVIDMKCVSNPLYFCLYFVYEGAGLPTVELSDVDLKIQDLISATVLEGIAGGIDTSRFAYKHIIGEKFCFILGSTWLCHQS